MMMMMMIVIMMMMTMKNSGVMNRAKYLKPLLIPVYFV